MTRYDQSPEQIHRIVPGVFGKAGMPDVNMDFYINGSAFSSLESELVCPAWLVPPTDHERPLLVVSSDQREMEFEGRKVKFSVKKLTFNSAEDTPMIVKYLNNSWYAVLMREHLCLAYNSALNICSGFQL